MTNKAGCFSFFIWVIFFLLIHQQVYASDGSGLQTSVAVDITADTALDQETETSDRMAIRGAEVMLYGPIDHTFDGKLSIAAHPEGGRSLFEVHEATIASSKLIPRSRFKVGQFFLGVGVLNQIHQHDWPFISSPFVHQYVFKDAEGALDSGGEYSILLPLPFYLDLTVGVTNGFTYGHSHGSGDKPNKPTHYGRVATYFSLYGAGFKPGISYLSRTDQEKNKMTLLGFDLTAKVRQGKLLTFLWLSEVWMRSYEPESTDKEETLGFYLYPQYGFFHHWYFGLRYDYFTNRTLEDIEGKSLANYRQSYVPTLTFQNSEFAKFRLAYNYEEIKDPTNKKSEKTEKQFLEFQATFILGAHPAHEF